MIKQSDLIIEGEVINIKSQWNEKHSIIYTDVILTIQKVEKGIVSGHSLTVRLLGGRVGDTSIVALGTPIFTMGNKVLLLLNESNREYLTSFLGESTVSKLRNSYQIVGPGQGYFEITIDSYTGEKFVKQKIDGMEFVNTVEEPLNLQRLPLSDVKQIIRKLK